MLEGWYGKIIGAILGAIIGKGLLGAIIGLVLGHQFDVAAARNRRRDALGRRDSAREVGSDSADGDVDDAGSTGAHDPAAMRRAFFEATFEVMGHVAKKRRPRHHAGDRRGAPGDAALCAERRRAPARDRTLHERQASGLSARGDARAVVPAGRRPGRPAAPLRADPARGRAAGQRVECTAARRLCAHLPHAAYLAARVRRARGDAAHARECHEWRRWSAAIRGRRRRLSHRTSAARLKDAYEVLGVTPGDRGPGSHARVSGA